MVVDAHSDDIDVLFVKWTIASQFTGRVVKLDAESRIIPLVGYAVPTRKFVGADIAIVDTGAAEWRVRPHRDRPKMYQWCLTLRSLKRAQFYQGPMPMVHDVQQCMVCSTMVDQGIDVHVQHDVFRCCQCAQPWHLECASYLYGEELAQAGFACPFCLDE
jgi:hypothetical protein